MAVTSGTPEMWTVNGVYREQRPKAFTPDGSRVIVTAGDSRLREFWSWSFAPRPAGVRVLPAGMTDSEGNLVTSGEPRIVLRHPRGGVRIAMQDATGTRPWKVGALVASVSGERDQDFFERRVRELLEAHAR